MASPVRIAAAQMCSGLDPAHNIAAIKAHAVAAAEAGANYMLTPEVSIAFAGNRAQLAEVARPFAGDPFVAACADIAKEHALYLHLGSMAVALENGRFANRSVLFGPDGARIATYDKIHLFDADPPGDRPYRESDTYEGGDAAVLAHVGDISLGMSICYDVRFPSLYAMLAEAGAEVLSVPAAFTVPTGEAHWATLLRARAIETGSYVIAAAQGGRHANGRSTWGHSMIIGPWGEVIADGGEEPGLITAELDFAEGDKARSMIPSLTHDRNYPVPELPKAAE